MPANIGTPLGRQDGQLTQSVALPAAPGSAYTPGIDTRNTLHGSFLARTEFVISAPALTTAEAPNGDTVTYAVQVAQDGDSAFASPTTINAAAIVQTGAGGAGAPAATARFRLPTNFGRYVRLEVTTGAGCGNCSASSASLSALC